MLNLQPVLSHPTLQKADQELEAVFKKAPHLPKKVTAILAKIAPYLVLVSGLFLITGGLRSVLGARDFQKIFEFWTGIPPVYFYLTGFLQIIAGGLSVMAYKPLKNRHLDGWLILLLLTGLTLIMNVISIFFFRDGLFGLLLSLLISLYVLYELKSEYLPKNSKKSKK